MTKNFIIAILAALLIWFGTALTHVENERYALLLDMCPSNAPLLVPDCQGVETRTGWIWHLAYGLSLL